MKVTTEKKPRSILALTVELEKEQIEKALDRAARRMSQKYNIPGFRKGKAPRFIIENYFGRAAILDEASEDLINRAFRDALDQEQIEPYGQPSLTEVSLAEAPYQFTVEVPVAPTVRLPDYRAIHVPFTSAEVTDDMLQRAMDVRRERHVVLRALETPRPAQQGDQLTVELETLVDGKPLDERPEGTAPPQSTLVLDPDRLVPGLYEGLLGMNAKSVADITARMPDDHSNEEVRGKDVRFVVNILDIQERLLPEWDELPTLENFDGTLEELREKTRGELIEVARRNAEDETIDEYVRQVVAATEFDIPDALIEREADRLLRQREAEFERYGVRPEQVYEIQGKKREDLLEELKPQAEERSRTNLVLSKIVSAEGLSPDEDEIDQEVERLAAAYDEARRDNVKLTLRTDLQSFVASSIIDRKLRRRLLVIATGDPSFEQQAQEAAAPAETMAGQSLEEPVNEEMTGSPDATDRASEPAAILADATGEAGTSESNTRTE